jgi:hypothetical protein
MKESCSFSIVVTPLLPVSWTLHGFVWCDGLGCFWFGWGEGMHIAYNLLPQGLHVVVMRRAEGVVGDELGEIAIKVAGEEEIEVAPVVLLVKHVRFGDDIDDGVVGVCASIGSLGQR